MSLSTRTNFHKFSANIFLNLYSFIQGSLDHKAVISLNIMDDDGMRMTWIIKSKNWKVFGCHLICYKDLTKSKEPLQTNI